MSESKTSWKVRPHGTLTEIDDGILTVTGTIEMPLMQLPRSMTLVRLADGRLVVLQRDRPRRGGHEDDRGVRRARLDGGAERPPSAGRRGLEGALSEAAGRSRRRER
jgi:hypothetical protein